MLYSSYNKNIEKLLSENFNLKTPPDNLKLIQTNNLIFLKSNTSTTVYNDSGDFFEIQPEEHSLLTSGEEKIHQLIISRYTTDLTANSNYEIEKSNENKFKFIVQSSPSEFAAVKISSNEKNLGFLFISKIIS